MAIAAFTPDRLYEKVKTELTRRGGSAAAPLCVALSGGADSTALLHALAQTQARPRLRALHVNHRLQAESDDWARICRRLCRDLGIPLQIIVVDAAAKSGQSPEEAARNARYAALDNALDSGECLLTAQHADDQVETLYLQLMRGAGLAGLAAMPTWRKFGDGHLLRPLLGWGRAELLDYVKQTGCGYVTDPHNDDERFDRVFLRKTIIPLLRSRWPGLTQSSARSVGHIAEAQSLIVELAHIDRRYAGAGRLQVRKLAELSLPRQRNLLRAWVRDSGRRVPPARRLEAFLDACASTRTDSAAALTWSDGAIRRFGDTLYLIDPLAELPPITATLTADDSLSLPFDLGRLSLQGGPVDAQGVRIPDKGFSVRFRQGGERLTIAGRAGSRSVKDLLREAGIVPWMRDRLPLLYDSEQLAAVADLWIHRDYQLRGGHRVIWQRHPPLR